LSRIEDSGHDPEPGPDGLDGRGAIPLEPVPPELAARTRLLIEAELRTMRPMSWPATLWVMATSAAVLVPGVSGVADLTLPALLGTVGLCGAYALLVRGMAHE
jgi:hypothetical protein